MVSESWYILLSERDMSCEMCLSYLRIIKIIYGTIKYVQCAHLIYVINILVSIYGEFIIPRLLKFATVRIRARVIYLRYHRWLRYTDTGAFIGEMKARAACGSHRIREAKKNSTDETRGQSGWRKKAPRRPFYRDNCTTCAGAHTSLYYVANFRSVILSPTSKEMINKIMSNY